MSIDPLSTVGCFGGLGRPETHALGDGRYIRRKFHLEETSGAELRAEVLHVQHGSSFNKHRVELYTVVEPEGVGADGELESAVDGRRFLARATRV